MNSATKRVKSSIFNMAFLTWFSSTIFVSTMLEEMSLHNLFYPINLRAPIVIS